MNYELKELRKDLKKIGVTLRKKTYSEFVSLTFVLPCGHDVSNLFIAKDDLSKKLYVTQINNLKNCLLKYKDSNLEKDYVGIKSMLS